MLKFNKKSILFHNPDYHCTFFYQTELRKIGWKADIFVSDTYPLNLLYSKDQIQRARKYTKIRKFDYLIWFMANFLKYKFIFYYGRPYNFSNLIRNLPINLSFDPLLLMLKIFRRKIIYLPSGCRDEFSKETFSLFDNGNICNNCGISDQCNDKSNIRNLNLINKYAHLVIGTGFTKPQINNYKYLKWKSFDLDVFNSDIIIPNKYVISDNTKFRILHITSLNNRENGGKNIKGSKFIIEAISTLKNEGYNCELMHFDHIESRNMKFIQAQADLIIDQLIYGHWGSTALEGVALGKPVICYFNKEWKDNYIKSLSIESWPFIEANPGTIYTVVKNLLDNPNLLIEYSNLSKDFATKYLDVKINVKDFVKCLEQI